MIYKVTQDDIRKTNDNIDAIEAFSVCSSRELKFVFLSYDYGTPFKQLAFEDRRFKVAIEVGYKMEKTRDYPDKTTRKLLNGGFPKVEAAIVAFKVIRRDLDREALEAYDIQLEEMNEMLRTKKTSDKEWDIAIKLVDKMTKFHKTRREMIDLLDLRADFKEELSSKIESDEKPKEKSALQRRNEKRMKKLEEEGE
jgi:hypothetical protein